VFIDPVARRIVEVGDTIPADQERSTVPDREGLATVWPLNTNGNEGRWRVSADSLRSMVDSGFAKVGAYDSKNDRYSILYLGQSQVARIATGEVRIIGRDDNNVVLVESDVEQDPTVIAKTVWYRLSHRAGEHGSTLVKKMLPGRDFPFPKSLYAVRDSLQIAVGSNPDALILDFFAGSGTTAHAAMLLNAADGGRRRTISVTNNEIPAELQARLRGQGFRPGDPGWEANGIFQYVTRPRIQSAVLGKDHNGESLESKYLDGIPMSDGLAENVEFFTLTYESPLRVASNRDFERIAPLLWLRAGARGRRIEDVSSGWDVAEAYGVLADLDKVDEFVRAVADQDGLSVAFIVTDEDRLFQSVVRDLPEGVEPVRLYEAYLRNFEIEAGRGVR
jgi:adenine-specific DNA-methyltransferase